MADYDTHVKIIKTKVDTEEPKPKKNLHDMCKDSWRWQSENPDGYEKKEDDG